MHLTTLELSPDEAAERLAAYQAQLASERTAEDDAIRAGYRAAARGLPIIDLPATIAAGGRFPNGLPRLAVVRANATECWVRVSSTWRNEHDVITYCDQANDRGRAAVSKHRVSVRAPHVGALETWGGHTIVPLIPPQFRPGRYRLHLFHILWEVEKWDPTPPVDPALLRHIRGNLWSVVATWDLSPLERAVLSARSST